MLGNIGLGQSTTLRNQALVGAKTQKTQERVDVANKTTETLQSGKPPSETNKAITELTNRDKGLEGQLQMAELAKQKIAQDIKASFKVLE